MEYKNNLRVGQHQQGQGQKKQNSGATGDKRKINVLRNQNRIRNRNRNRHRHRHRRVIEEPNELENDENYPSLGSLSDTNRSLQTLDPDRDSIENDFVCQSIDVVDACRGTSAAYRYRGTFVPYEGPCRGGNKILEGYPIYKSVPEGPNEIPKYMYAVGVYSQSWSIEELRGLVRWRIVDFENFGDQESCRAESANINQIDFAADGQPYNYHPTIFCFDENGNELDGYKSSTINIRCNDRTPNNNNNNNGESTGANTGGTNGINPYQNPGGPGQENSNTAMFLGILLIASAVVFAAYVLYKRCCRNNRSKYSNYKYGMAPTKATTNTEGGDTGIPSVIGGNDNDQDSDTEDSEYNYPPHDTANRKGAHDSPEQVPDLETNPLPRVEKPLPLPPPPPPPKRPFSTSSIMADDDESCHSGFEGLGGPRRPSSMHTVSKPYELLERRMAKQAPEPPQTTSSTPDSSPRDGFPRKFFAANRSDTENRREHNPENNREGNDNNPHSQKQAPTHHNHHTPVEESTTERKRENFSSANDSRPLEKSFNEESTFMSESLSNLFKNIDKSLDEALSSEDESDSYKNTGQNTNQNGSRDPPQVKTPIAATAATTTTTAPRRSSSSRKLDKTDEMDLSQRSKFMEARGKWSARGRAAFGKDEFRRSRSLDNSKASKHAAAATTTTPAKGSRTKGKVDDILSEISNNGGGSSNRHIKQPRRSKSLDNSKAKDYANFRRTAAVTSPKRSRSQERTEAESWAQQQRGKSNQRSSSKGRSRSRERSGANDYYSQRKSNNAHPSEANRQTIQNGRSRSKERSGANIHASRNVRRSRSREVSASNAFAGQNKEARRGRSKERSRANDFSSSGKPRPKSLEQSGSRQFAKHKGMGRPGRSLERTQADKHMHSSKQQKGTTGTPKGRSRSFDSSGAKKFASQQGKGSGGGGGTPKTRSHSFDSSKANHYAERQRHLGGRPQPGKKSSNGAGTTPVPPKPSTTITKNPDGSVVVARKRRREDGATVTTKTKYANISLARKHGIPV